MLIPSSNPQLREVSVIEHLMAAGDILPSQVSSRSTWSPERRLAGAVLGQTLVEIRDHSHNLQYQRHIVADLEWVASDDTSWPYSFLRLCEVIGLEPEYVRWRVRQWTQPIPRPRQRRWSVHRHAG
jgi:hypothetical protein